MQNATVGMLANKICESGDGVYNRSLQDSKVTEPIKTQVREQ